METLNSRHLYPFGKILSSSEKTAISENSRPQKAWLEPHFKLDGSMQNGTSSALRRKFCSVRSEMWCTALTLVKEKLKSQPFCFRSIPTFGQRLNLYWGSIYLVSFIPPLTYTYISSITGKDGAQPQAFWYLLKVEWLHIILSCRVHYPDYRVGNKNHHTAVKIRKPD